MIRSFTDVLASPMPRHLTLAGFFVGVPQSWPIPSSRRSRCARSAGRIAHPTHPFAPRWFEPSEVRRRPRCGRLGLGRWRWFGRRGVAAAVDQARRAAGSPGGVERCLNCSEPGCAEPCTEWPARWSRELVLARAGNVLFAVTPAMASDKRSPAPVQKSLIFGGFWWAHQGSNLGPAD